MSSLQPRNNAAIRRRPFDSINANTLSASLARAKNGGSASSANGGGAGATSSLAAGLPVKKETKLRLLSRKGRLLSSILTTTKGRKENGPDDVSASLESPTKKIRTNDNDVSPTFSSTAYPSAATATSTTAALSRTNSNNSTDSEFTASDVVSIFRQRSNTAQDVNTVNFWNEMEDMMTIRPANPIFGEGRDDNNDGESMEEREASGAELRDVNTVQSSLEREIDENVGGDPLSFESSVFESDVDGFRINYVCR